MEKFNLLMDATSVIELSNTFISVCAIVGAILLVMYGVWHLNYLFSYDEEKTIRRGAFLTISTLVTLTWVLINFALINKLNTDKPFSSLSAFAVLITIGAWVYLNKKDR